MEKYEKKPMKERVTLTISGVELNLVTEESAEYMEKLAEDVLTLARNNLLLSLIKHFGAGLDKACAFLIQSKRVAQKHISTFEMTNNFIESGESLFKTHGLFFGGHIVKPPYSFSLELTTHWALPSEKVKRSRSPADISLTLFMHLPSESEAIA